MTCASATRGRASALAFGVALCFPGVVLGCGGADVRPETAEGSFAVWQGHDREIFDDSIAPEAVGLLVEGKAARTDAVLKERAKAAELVSRLRVTTVTVDKLDTKVTYHLVVQIVPPPFQTPAFSATTFELEVGPASRAYGITRAFDTRLRGASFIGFLRRFAGEGGEPAFHWHLAPDSPEVEAAVRDALDLAELSGS